MNRRIKALALIGVAALAAAAAGCGGNGGGAGGDKTLEIGVDLPFQGASKDASDDTWNAMVLYLEQQGGKAGKYKVALKKYDNSTAAKGAWDEATCSKNAGDHVANANEVAVMGTYNSGCAKLEAPVLNQDPKGPMLMISHANTNPGLTKTWDPGEPQKYFPTGKRNYARVVTTDDIQGPAAAQFAAKDLHLTKCYVLNDNETYGQGVAKTFAAEAKKQGIQVVGEQAWDKAQPNYTALFEAVKATGADCVYFGGIFDNNGGQLTKDKVKVLGDNETVKLLAPDGFTGYPDFNALAESQGSYLTFAGLSTDPLRAAGGKPAAFLDAYKAKYGSDPRTSYALYGVQALQVILAAIEKSDGTRKSVRDQVFEGAGVTVPATVAVLGKEVKIDPATGDVNVKDISIELEKGNKETFHKAWPVS
ncbi:MAG: branched-chain amino acid ABC transporter substrate-binding protein [Micromonosporaceae bacterium]